MYQSWMVKPEYKLIHLGSYNVCIPHSLYNYMLYIGNAISESKGDLQKPQSGTTQWCNYAITQRIHWEMVKSSSISTYSYTMVLRFLLFLFIQATMTQIVFLWSLFPISTYINFIKQNGIYGTLGKNNNGFCSLRF